MKVNSWVYVIRLANNKLYVGSTGNLLKRIDAHLTARGSVATKANAPIDIIEIYPCESRSNAYALEAYLQHLQRTTAAWLPPKASSVSEVLHLQARALDHRVAMRTRYAAYMKRKVRVPRVGRSVQPERRSVRELARSALDRFIVSL